MKENENLIACILNLKQLKWSISLKFLSKHGQALSTHSNICRNIVQSDHFQGNRLTTLTTLRQFPGKLFTIRGTQGNSSLSIPT